MPFYSRLAYDVRDDKERTKVVSKLLSLRRRLDRHLPSKDADDNLVLATWNIRDFDKANRRGYGKRLPESLYYIAEIISRFDFVAVQEVNRLREWEKVMQILGSKWDYIATDVTDPKLGGNGERMVFAYDTRKVSFQNIAGEIVLPTNMLISQVEVDDGTDTFTAGKQFRRTPFLASFQAGWFKFDICTVHLYYGASSGEKLQERVEEINAVAEYFGERADIGLKGDRALILLGDFNIVSPEHRTMQALKRNGFRVPKDLGPSNVKGDKYYDQIAFKTKKDVLDYIDSNAEDPKERNAGVFDLFGSAFKTGQVSDYRSAMKATSALSGKKYKRNLKKYYRDWRTYQLSDHNPMWVRLSVNESEKYLRSLQGA